MTIRLVLVRHGLSSFNAKGLIQGRTDDSLLTDKLMQQFLVLFDLYQMLQKVYSNYLLILAAIQKKLLQEK